VAHYKILAKLGSGLHKPAQQTLVPAAAVGALLAPLPIGKLRSLGGKVMLGGGRRVVGQGTAALAIPWGQAMGWIRSWPLGLALMLPTPCPPPPLAWS
jgi:hypothetical protein